MAVLCKIQVLGKRYYIYLYVPGAENEQAVTSHFN